MAVTRTTHLVNEWIDFTGFNDSVYFTDSLMKEFFLTQLKAPLYMIAFEIDGQRYAIASSELAGVAAACPFAAYAGLPQHVSAIVQWSGKIFPVLDVFGGSDLAKSHFLFSRQDMPGHHAEFALAISDTATYGVQVFVAREQIELERTPQTPVFAIATVRDRAGAAAIRVSMRRIALYLQSLLKEKTNSDTGRVAA